LCSNPFVDKIYSIWIAFSKWKL